jgi:PAS domain S-box-containing protein
MLSVVGNSVGQEPPEQRRYLYDVFVGSVAEFAIFLLDSEGRVVTWNEGARRTFGYGADEIIGKTFTVLYTADDLAASVPERELRAATQEGSASDDRWLVRKDGERIWVTGVTVGLTRDGQPYYGKIIRDQTVVRQKEERIEQLNNDLGEKVTELERFEEVTVGRELKMIDLKRELERIKKRLHELESRHGAM